MLFFKVCYKRFINTPKFPDCMVSGRFKSRTFRRVKVKTPGGRTVMHYRKRKPAKAKCANCGDVLKGVARVSSAKLKATAKSKKRPVFSYLQQGKS